MTMAPPQDRLYQRLARRNRLVSILRIGVPVLGVVVLAGLCIQIYIASFAGRFAVGNIEVTPEAVTVDAPEYSGILDDGSAYRVWADEARAPLDRADIVDLTGAQVVVNRVDGVQMQAETDRAQLDSVGQLTIMPGTTDIADSTGTIGTLDNSVFDWGAQVLTAQGNVSIDKADGTTIRAEGLVYDADASIWTFTRSVVTLPSTPGEDLGPGSGD